MANCIIVSDQTATEAASIIMGSKLFVLVATSSLFLFAVKYIATNKTKI